jgi:hypothetical protein
MTLEIYLAAGAVIAVLVVAIGGVDWWLHRPR